MNYKKFSLIVISGLLLVMLLTGITVYYIDPFFQYHKPNKNMSYVLDTNSFAYINPGIAKNFEYDTVITGSSMSRAIEPSYVNDVLGGKTVKLSMAEARGKDLSELFEVLEKQSNVKKIVMSLDTFAYSVDKDYSTYTYPLYLYDENCLNDVLYLMNMKGLTESYNVLKNTKNKSVSTNMDQYQNYVYENTFSKEKVLEIYNTSKLDKQEVKYDRLLHKQTVMNNLEQNIIPMIEKREDIEFLFYFPPYSIVRWGITENVKKEIDTMIILVEQLISYDNVSVFFYQGKEEVITSLDHYMDSIHFDTEVANDIVNYISNPQNRLTQSNYVKEISEFEKFVLNYDYTKLNN